MCKQIAISFIRSYQSINHTHAHRHRLYAMAATVSLSSCLLEPQTCFSCPTRNAFHHVTQRWGCCERWSGERGQVAGGWERSRRGNGRPTAVSHQHSVNCSQPVAASQGHGGRVQLGALQGPKIPSIRRSSQFVWPYPRRPLHTPLLPSLTVSAFHALAFCANPWPRACCSRHHLGAIMPFPHCFPSFHCWLCCVLQLPSACVGFSSLGLLPSPPSPPGLVIQDWQRLH